MWLFRKANLLEWNILHRIDHLIIHPKIANIFDHIQASKTNSWKTKHANFFFLSTGLLYKLLPTNLGVFKPTFYNFYTSHLRWNSTIYHTDLGQNAVFHNFSRQIALSQYSGRSIVGFKRNRSKIYTITQLCTTRAMCVKIMWKGCEKCVKKRNHVKSMLAKIQVHHISISHACELCDMHVKFCNTCEKVFSYVSTLFP